MRTFKRIEFSRRSTGGVWMRCYEPRAEDAPVSHFSFMWSAQEWSALSIDPRAIVVPVAIDLWTMARRIDDEISFVQVNDMSFLPGQLKAAQAVTWVMSFPFEVVQKVTEKLAEIGQDEWFDVPMGLRNLWAETLGRGTGGVVIEKHGDKTEALMAAETSKEFHELVERWKRMARNTTRNSTEVAKVQIFAESDSFYSITALSPKGIPVFPSGGGLARSSDGSWSSHT